MYQNAISLALAGKITHQTATSLQALHAAVCYRIQCSCGSILDSRKAVLFEYSEGTAISCGPCHDKRADKVKAGVIVTDARLYKTDGTLKPVKAPTPVLKLSKLKRPIEFAVNNWIGTSLVQGLKVLEIHGLTFYLHGKAGDWILSEYSSGLKASNGKTQKTCLKLFESKLDELGKDLWLAAIKANFERYGIINK